MAIKYNNICRGVEVEYTADQYELHFATKQTFEKQFFDDHRDLISKFTKKEYTNGTILYTVKYKELEKEVCILWGPLKNSGTAGKSNKRIQVLPCVNLKPEIPYFAIGAYNAQDSYMYFIIKNGVREFIKHAQNGSSYSSLWIDYPSMWNTYKNGSYTWVDKAKRNVLGCKATNVIDIHDSIIQLLSSKHKKETQKDNTQTNADPSTLVDFSNEIRKYKDTDKLPRNPLFREIALQRENYTCELCGTHKTFTDKNDTEYFEGHHLIMYNPSVQRRFKYCLDHPDNIICLCPNCHSKIHHSSLDDTINMLLDLFTKHNKLLTTYGIRDLSNIIKDYNNN